MKKFLLLILTLCMSAFLGCSCGDNGDGPIVETLPPAPEAEATLSLDSSELSLIVGEEKYLSAQTNNLDGYTLSFASNNDNVALVDNAGKITAFSEGTAVITATYTNGTKTKTATCNLAVGFANYVPFVEIDGGLQDVTQIALNDTLSVSPYISFNNLAFYDATYEYTSLNNAIVEVNGNNELVAKGLGETFVVVKATWRNKTSDDFKTLTNTFKVKVINSVIFFANGSPLEDIQLFTRSDFYGKSYDIKTPLNLTATINGEAYDGNIKVSIEDGEIALFAKDKIYSAGYGETVANVSIDYDGESFGDSFKIKVERPVVEIEEEVLKFSTYSGMYKDVHNGLRNTTLVEGFFEPGKTIYDAYQYMADGTMKPLTFIDGCVYDIVSSDEDMAGTAKIILGTSTEKYILNLETYSQLFSSPEDLLHLVVSKEKKITGYCELLNDIDATGLTFNHDESLYAKAGFHAIFEGNGHVISNVTLNKISGADYGESLFGVIGPNTVLRNFALYNLSCTECYLIAQSSTDGHTIENVYINVSSNTSTPKGLTNSIGTKNNYKAIVIDYFASNRNLGLTDAGIPNFAIGHSGSKAEYSSFAGSVSRTSGYNKINDGTWKDVYVFSKLPILNHSNITLGATDVAKFNLPSTFDSGVTAGNMNTRVTAIGYGANETVDLWGNEIKDDAPVIDSDPTYKNSADPYNIRRFFLNLRFSNVYRYDSYEDLAATKDDQAENQWANFSSDYWMISNGVPYFKSLYNIHVDLGFYDDNDEFVQDVVFDEATDKFTVKFKDGDSLGGTPIVSIEANDYIEVVGNVLKIKKGADIPTVPHEYVVTASQVINDIHYVKTKVITVAKAIDPIEERVVFEADSGKILSDKIKGEMLSFTVVDDNAMYVADVENGAVVDAVVRNANSGYTLKLKVKLGNNVFVVNSLDEEFIGYVVYVETTEDVYKFTNVEFASKVITKVEDLAYLSVNATSGNTAPYVILGNSIDAKGYKHIHAKEVSTTGRLQYSFNGIFDGKGNTIANLDLTDNVGGLFGAFDYSTVVKNLGLYNVKAVNSPVLANRAKLTSLNVSETENNGIVNSGSKFYPQMQFSNIYVKLANSSKNVKGLISNFDNNQLYLMNHVVVDFENAPNVTVEKGVVKENGVEVSDTIGVLTASTSDSLFGFVNQEDNGFRNNYFITSYPLIYRNKAWTMVNNKHFYTYGSDSRLANNTGASRVWGIASNGTLPDGVSEMANGSVSTAFGALRDIRSEQYATKQDLINANKDLSSFNKYWDTSSGAPVWKSLQDVSITYKIFDANQTEVDEMIFDDVDDVYSVSYEGTTEAPTIEIEENEYIELVDNVIKVKQGVSLPLDSVEIRISISQTIGGKEYANNFVAVVKMEATIVEAKTYFDLASGTLDTNAFTGNATQLTLKYDGNSYPVTLNEGKATDVSLVVVSASKLKIKVGAYENIELNETDGAFSTFEALVAVGKDIYYFEKVQIVSKALKEKEDLAYLTLTANNISRADYVVLANNVDATGYTHTQISTSTRLQAFNGIFEGQGYTISNLDLSNVAGGLFGSFDHQATIRNVGLYNVKVVSAPVLASYANTTSATYSVGDTGLVATGKTYPSFTIRGIYVKLTSDSKDVKGLVSNFGNSNMHSLTRIVVDWQDAPAVTVENGVVKEGGVAVSAPIGILQASNTDKAYAFNANNIKGFGHNYFITSYPLMYRSTSFTPNDTHIYNGPNYADKLSTSTTIGRVWGMASNSVAPNGVTKTVKGANATTNAFSYIVDIKSKQYATYQEYVNASKDLTAFNEYWDTTSGAPVWKTIPQA